VRNGQAKASLTPCECLPSAKAGHREAGGKLYPQSAKEPARFPFLLLFLARKRQGAVLNCNPSGAEPCCCAGASFSKQGSPGHGHLEAAGSQNDRMISVGRDL